MNPIVEKVYQIGIIPVIALNSVDEALDRKSTRLNSSHWNKSRMPSSA